MSNEEDKELIHRLRHRLFDVTMTLKIVISGIIGICFCVLLLCYQYLLMLAAIGGSKVAEQYGDTGSNLLLAGFNFSHGVICISFMLLGGLLLFYIWNDEVTVLFDKMNIAIRGAQKELQKDDEEKP